MILHVLQMKTKLKYLDIGDEKYHKSYQQNFIIDKNDVF